VVRWDQKPLPDGSEPEHPVPALALTAEGSGHGDHGATAEASPVSDTAAAPGSTADNSARWMAGGALILAAIAVAVALVSRRRT
jgi:hypothetical protein